MKGSEDAEKALPVRGGLCPFKPARILAEAPPPLPLGARVWATHLPSRSSANWGRQGPQAWDPGWHRVRR